jgi:uncharacterized protein YjbI with pentapeptide repeats
VILPLTERIDEIVPSELREPVQELEEKSGLKLSCRSRFTDGKSGALVYLVEAERERFVDFLGVLKIETPELASYGAPEAKRHEAARSTAWGRRHIPKLLNFSTYSVSGREHAIMLYEIVGQNRSGYTPLGKITDHHEILRSFRTIGWGLLQGWNAKQEASNGKHPQEILSDWLGDRLSKDTLVDFLRDTCNVDPTCFTFRVGKEVMPNPLQYARSTENWGSSSEIGRQVISPVRGHIHGDLNEANVFVNLTKSNSMEFQLIDFSHYELSGYLFFDNAYLVLAHILRESRTIHPGNCSALFLSLTTHKRASGLTSDLVDYYHLFDSVYSTVESWSEKWRNRSLQPDIIKQFYLANVGAAMNFCFKKGLSPDDRYVCFLYSSFYLRVCLEALGVKWMTGNTVELRAPNALFADSDAASIGSTTVVVERLIGVPQQLAPVGVTIRADKRLWHDLRHRVEAYKRRVVGYYKNRSGSEDSVLLQSFKKSEMYDFLIPRRCHYVDGRAVGGEITETIVKYVRSGLPGPIDLAHPPSKLKPLLIMGEYGIGKSTVCYVTLKKLCEELNDSIIPFLIPMSVLSKNPLNYEQLKDEIFNFMVHEYKELLVNRVVLNNLTKEARLVLILDGLDEMSSDLDDASIGRTLSYVKQLATEHIVVLTTRQTYLQNFINRLSFDYEVLLISDYDPGEIEAFINRKYGSDPIRARRIFTVISEKQIKDLAKKPIFLRVIGERIEEIQKHPVINAATLLQILTDEWIVHDVEKDDKLTDQVKREEKETRRKLSEILAIAVNRKGPIDIKSIKGELESEFGTYQSGRDKLNRYYKDARDSTFLITAGEKFETFKFVHKSIVEYFVARRIVDSIRLGEPSLIFRDCKEARSDEIFEFIRSILENELVKNPNLAQNIYDAISESRRHFPRPNVSSLVRIILMMRKLPLKPDLSKLNLSGLVLAFANLEGANLDGASLLKSRLECVNLSHASLKGANLQDADISYSKLASASFEDAKLIGSNLTGSDLMGANFGYSDLTGASFTNVEIDRSTNFAHAISPPEIRQGKVSREGSNKEFKPVIRDY